MKTDLTELLESQLHLRDITKAEDLDKLIAKLRSGEININISVEDFKQKQQPDK